MHWFSRNSFERKSIFSLDPRTKLLLVFIEATIVLATAGGAKLYYFRLIFMFLPFLLLLIEKEYKTCLIGLLILIVTETLDRFYFPTATGTAATFLMIWITLITRFLPAYLMGKYVIATTKISEFKAAMERLHVPDEITIPMCVMFRFFPTVVDECASINAAMKMRGIALGGGKAAGILEYRIVPMISCSAKIGEELSAAAITRGLGKSRKRTNICRIGFGMFDMVIFALAFSMVLYGILGV